MHRTSSKRAPSARRPIVLLALLVSACGGQPAVTARPMVCRPPPEAIPALVDPTAPDVPPAAPMLVFVPGSTQGPPQLLPAKLTGRQIRATLGRARAAIGACGATVAHAPRVVRVRFRIQPHSTARDATVTRVAIVDPPTVDPRLARCVTEQVSALTFPRFQGQAIPKSLGFALRRADDVEAWPLPMPDPEMVAAGAVELSYCCPLEDIASQLPRAAIARCLAAETSSPDTRPPVFSFAWTIEADGRASNPRVLGPPSDDPVAKRCARTLERMAFPRSDPPCRVSLGNPVQRP